MEIQAVYKDHGNHVFKRISHPDVDRIVLLGVGTSSSYDTVVFKRDSPPKAEYFLTAAKSVSNINLEDVTKTIINVELAGGLCNRTMGDAIILIKRDQCPNFVRPILIQTFQTPLSLPAQQLVVAFGGLKTDNINFALEVKRYLHAINKDVDVVDLRNSTDQTSVYSTTRFEFHPLPSLRVEVSAAKKPKCANPNIEPPLVVESLTVTNVTIFVSEEFPGVDACDDVRGSLNITNFWGEDLITVPALSMCRYVPCVFNLTSDQLVNTNSNLTI